MEWLDDTVGEIRRIGLEDWSLVPLFGRKQPRLEQLVPRLGDPGFEGDAAVAELRALGDAALDTLIALVRFDDQTMPLLRVRAPSARRRAVQLLAELDSPRAADVLLQTVMRETDSSIGHSAASASALRLLPHAPDQLLAALVSDQVHVRRNAAWALGTLGEKRAVQTLLTMLQDEDEDQDVRGAAASALGYLKDQRALAPLVDALKDPQLGFLAAHALGSLGDKAAVEPLALALDDESEIVRRAAFSSLRQIGDGLALEPLISLALRAVDPHFRSEVIYAVRQMDPDAADRVMDEIHSAGVAAERRAASDIQTAAGDVRKGPMGETYCSERCYELGGQTVARHVIHGWVGDCSVCRGDLRIGPGQSGSMVCYKPGLFLYFHQQPSCESAVRAELAKGTPCVVCGTSVT